MGGRPSVRERREKKGQVHETGTNSKTIGVIAIGNQRGKLEQIHYLRLTFEAATKGGEMIASRAASQRGATVVKGKSKALVTKFLVGKRELSHY